MAINEDNLIALITKTSLSLSCALAICGWFFFSGKFGYSILTGGMLTLANFIWMKFMLVRVLYNTPSKPSRYAHIQFILRFSAVALILYFVLTSGLFSVIGLVLGLSIIVINILGFTLYFSVSTGG